MENVKRYRMPDEKTGKNEQDLVYTEVDEREKGPNAEQVKWEEEQMGFAQYHFGAKDAEARNKTKDYEIVLDSEIEFVQALKALPGTKTEDVSAKLLGRFLFLCHFSYFTGRSHSVTKKETIDSGDKAEFTGL